MQVGVYKHSGGKDIVLGENYSPETKAALTIVLKKLCSEGLDGFDRRLLDKESNPKLWEIKWRNLRVLYFVHEGNVYIPHIIEHKQKNKTEENDKKTAVQRIRHMLNSSENHVAWL